MLPYFIIDSTCIESLCVYELDRSELWCFKNCIYSTLFNGLYIVYSSLYIIVYNQRRQWHPTPVLLPGKSHGWRSLEGCSPWGRWGSDTTEWLHFHFSLSCIGEGNGNPLQCSCLENPRDGGAWWAAVYGVAQSRTQLKWLSKKKKKKIEAIVVRRAS